ncbi:PAS domain S-box protein [Algoriphagus sp. AK58]|uniref:PAS domain S-box protein n=1 Tax=Algoriphagus sp. AK58 TaxID=1406877 RepID=UPI00164F10BB|nr:PAS domain S-box protein [Algoriphagus sp. AK58]MBC6366418.1 hypothetical protein [Algoriphagus sp. AK58]
MITTISSFLELLSQTFGKSPCYVAAWSLGNRLLESGVGIAHLETVRNSIEGHFSNEDSKIENRPFEGALFLSSDHPKAKYQGWSFEIPSHDVTGVLVVFENPKFNSDRIGVAEIYPWIQHLTTVIQSHLEEIFALEAEVLKAVLDTSSEMVVLIAQDHRVFGFNQVAQKLLKQYFNKEIQKGDDYREYVLPHIMELYKEGFGMAIVGKDFFVENHTVADSADYWFEYRLSPIYNPGKRLIGVCLRGKDITNEKVSILRLKELAETFNALNENLNEEVVILDKDFRILRFNSRIKERLELNTEKIISEGMDFREVLYFGSEEVFEKNFKKALKGELTETEGTFSSKHREKIWIRTRFIPIFLENRKVAAVGILIKNIQEEKMLEFALKESEEKFRKIVNSAAMAILITDQQQNITMVNPEVFRVFGHSEEELIGQSIQILIPQRFHENHTHHQRRYVKSPVPMRMMENRNTKALKKNGDEIDVEVSLNSFSLGEKIYFMAMILDVTERNRLAKLFNDASELSLTGNWEYTLLGTGEESLYWSPMTKRIIEVEQDFKPQFSDLKKFFVGESYSILENKINRLIDTGESYDLELMIQTRLGKTKWVRSIGTIESINGNGKKLFGSIQDITDKKLKEIELIQSLQSNKNYRVALEQSNLLMVTGLDGNIIDVNESWCQLTEYSREELIGASANITKSDYHPESFFDELWETIRSGQIWKGEIKDISKNGNYFWVDTTIIPMKNEKEEVYQYLTLRNNITDKKSATEELEIRAKELARSNAELEQFAYVASHDLQEPLRMVTSFLTQLKRKYAGDLDDTAKRYIDFAIEGGHRMRSTILDLLEFSRVGKSWEEKEEIKLNKIIDIVISQNRKLIEESQAQIIVDELPVLLSYSAQLLLVFGNLINNAIKYRKPGSSPLIKISVEDKQDHWQFSVSDDGIGFSMDYAEKVFVIFQRLHTRENYNGNGIGLAIVKKVIDNLQGKIWVESKENVGTTFYFTLPK